MLLQIAQFAAELERYPQAVKIYEDVARACVDNNLLKYRYETAEVLGIKWCAVDVVQACGGAPGHLGRQGPLPLPP